MSLLGKCRRDCTGQPGDGLCRQWSQVALSISSITAVLMGGSRNPHICVSCRSRCDRRAALQPGRAVWAPLADLGCSGPPPWAAWLLSWLQTCFDWNMSALSSELPEFVADTEHSHINQFFGHWSLCLRALPRGPGHSSELLQPLALCKASAPGNTQPVPPCSLC